MRTMILGAMMALWAAPAAAQQHGQHPQQMQMMHDQAQMCMAMMGGASPAMLLQHRDALGLSQSQVQRLERLQNEVQTSVMPHMRPGMQAHAAAAEVLKADTPDFAAYEARLREGADHMVRTHVALARVGVEARKVLTAEQRNRVSNLQGEMMSGGQQGMMRGGQQGMAQGGHAMGGMMMMCMGPGGGQEGAAHRH